MKIIFGDLIERIFRNYLKTVMYHCEQRNNDKIKKTFFKMAKTPKMESEKLFVN